MPGQTGASNRSGQPSRARNGPPRKSGTTARKIGQEHGLFSGALANPGVAANVIHRVWSAQEFGRLADSKWGIAFEPEPARGRVHKVGRHNA